MVVVRVQVQVRVNGVVDREGRRRRTAKNRKDRGEEEEEERALRLEERTLRSEEKTLRKEVKLVQLVAVAKLRRKAPHLQKEVRCRKNPPKVRQVLLELNTARFSTNKRRSADDLSKFCLMLCDVCAFVCIYAFSFI